MSNPIAPIGHHWLDATHITFGVVTTGVYSGRWKVEASAFNGREPDENRTDFDLGALDSYSARVSVAPAASTVLQVSAGRLNDAEAEAGLPPNDVTRVTASAAYNRTLGASALWASTIAWGMNDEPIATTHALLVESTLSLRDRHVGFMRFEVVGKPAHDLHVHESNDVFTVGKIQVGYAEYLRPTRGSRWGLGGSIAGSLVPSALAPRYGGRVAPGGRCVPDHPSGRSFDVISWPILWGNANDSWRCAGSALRHLRARTESRAAYLAGCIHDGSGRAGQDVVQLVVSAMPRRQAAGQHGAGPLRRPVLHDVGQRAGCLALREDSRHHAAELRYQHRRSDQARCRRLHPADQRLSRRARGS